MSNTIAAIILTKNEELHIERCIASLQSVCEEIFVIDSFSIDKTCEIAEKLGAKIFKNKWINYAKQFNWALKNCPIQTEWCWRIDADEYLDNGLRQAIKPFLEKCDKNVNGIFVRKRIDFMGKPLLHGGWYPSYHLKIWRRGFGECENKWMDEHIRLLSGKTEKLLVGNQIDSNLNNLTWWWDKHNGYATREALDMLLTDFRLANDEIEPKLFGSQPERKRWLKIKYAKMPLFIRPCINFFLRYFLYWGFWDGKEGLIWHFLQGFAYRFLVDAKVFEIKKRFNWDYKKIKAFLIENYLN